MTLTEYGPNLSEGEDEALKMKWFVQGRAACQQPGRDRNTFTDGAKLVRDDHPWAAVCLYKIAQNMLISQCSLWPLYFLSFSFLLHIFLLFNLSFINFDYKTICAHSRDSRICC